MHLEWYLLFWIIFEKIGKKVTFLFEIIIFCSVVQMRN